MSKYSAKVTYEGGTYLLPDREELHDYIKSDSVIVEEYALDRLRELEEFRNKKVLRENCQSIAVSCDGVMFFTTDKPTEEEQQEENDSL